jgi:hypothetical protein
MKPAIRVIPGIQREEKVIVRLISRMAKVDATIPRRRSQKGVG